MAVFRQTAVGRRILRAGRGRRGVLFILAPAGARYLDVPRGASQALRRDVIVIADAETIGEQSFKLTVIVDFTLRASAIDAFDKAVPAQRKPAVVSLERAYASLREVADR
jgi:hypothetical protein